MNKGSFDRGQGITPREWFSRVGEKWIDRPLSREARAWFALMTILFVTAPVIGACATAQAAEDGFVDVDDGTVDSDDTVDDSPSIGPSAISTPTIDSMQLPVSLDVGSGDNGAASLQVIDGVEDFGAFLSNFEGSKVSWYPDPQHLVTVAGAESGMTMVSAFQVKDASGGVAGELGLVTSGINSLHLVERIGANNWAVLTSDLEPVDGDNQENDGLVDVVGWAHPALAFGVFDANGNATPKVLFELGADGQPTGNAMHCDNARVCRAIDMGTSMDNTEGISVKNAVLEAFSPDFGEGMVMVGDQLDEWGVDSGTLNYTYHADTGLLGVDMGNGVFLTMDGKALIMVDNETVEVDAGDVVYEDGKFVGVDGFELGEDGGWVEVAKTPAEAWAEENGGQYDAEKEVAWDSKTGLIMWAKDASGEWVNYPDGNVPIPPGPGYEDEPPLEVPFYHSFNEAIAAITDKLPWGEIPNVVREAQETAKRKISNTYWKPWMGSWDTDLFDRVDIHDARDPLQRAQIFVSQMLLPDGRVGMRLAYSSSTTGYYDMSVLISEDLEPIYDELVRIEACVEANKDETDLAELCKSEIVAVNAPAK